MRRRAVGDENMKAVANFLFEVGILSKTPRSGFHFLGSGQQSVAEHTHRVVYVGYVLAMMEGDCDVSRVMKMCLFHDLCESRTSDLNYVHQKYTQSDEESAIKDLTDTLEFGSDMLETLKEFQARETKEAILARDADQIEWILSLKEQVDIGNARAKSWIPSAAQRLKTKGAQELAVIILQANSDDWWFIDKESRWWVDRNKRNQKGRF